MNENPFDNEKRNLPPETSEYPLYSREYKPNGEQYKEYFYTYSPEMRVEEKEKKKKPRKSGIG
jgi:hypothetical protein